MNQFYFNDCLPPEPNQTVFIQKLSATLKEFNILLLNEDLNVEWGIITEKLPSNIFFGNSYSLQSVIDQIPDRDLKNLAYSVFNKYPIGIYFDDSADFLFEHEFNLVLDPYKFNSLNLTMVSSQGGILFSTGLHFGLCVHPIQIQNDTTKESISADNLYGSPKNTVEIEEIIKLRNVNLKGLEDQLKNVLGLCVFSSQFKREFRRLNDLQKISIIEQFQFAKNRKLKSDFYPDTKIVKQVFPKKPKITVYELKIYTPDAIRVYFHEGNEKVFVASIGFKNEDNQDDQIDQANKILYNLILTN